MRASLPPRVTRLVLLSSAMAVLAACGVSPTASSSIRAADATGSGVASGGGVASVPADAPVNCPISRAPGPVDEPSRDGSDLIDMGDFGGGRWRLCLTGPTLATAEHSAWCVWNADRSAVTEVQGLPVPIGGIEYDTTLSFDRADFNLGLTDRGSGMVATYTAEGGLVVVKAADDRTAGAQTFDVVVMQDPEAGAPAGLPPRFAGAMRWSCAAAPPAR